MHGQRTTRRISAVVLAAGVLAIGALGAQPVVAAETDPVNIDIVTINDFHGRIEQSAPAAGAAVLAGAVDQIRTENPNTIFAAAGDLIGASTFTSFIDHDNPTIDALSAAGLDVSSVGNHEFDQGWADLRDRVVPRASWDYIGSNVFLRGTDETALPAYSTKEVGGVTVGFIGAVTEQLPSLVSPAGIADLEVRGIVDSVNTVADDLRDGDPANGEADVVILLVHEGAETTDIANAEDPSTPLGGIVAGVDDSVNAIVSAHTHLQYSHTINGRLVTSAGQYGEAFGHMKLSVNPETGEILSFTNTIEPLLGNPAGEFPADPDVAAIVESATETANELGAAKVGDITGDFARASQPEGGENRGGESTLGNFVADVQLWSAQQQNPDVEIAFMNPGGLRADLRYASSGETDPDGNLTYAEAALVQPFANTLVTKEYTGAEIAETLEQQWQPEGAARPFLKLGVSEGLTYSYDPDAPAGSHLVDVRLNGEPLEDDASYTVVVNSFLASGGDNFFALAGGSSAVDTGKVDLQSMVDYFAEQAEEPVSPDYRQRAVGAVLSAPDADGYNAGDSITLTLSSLDLSNANEPKAGTVDATIGGEPLGSAEVDPAGVANFDEYGTATIEGTIPEGVEGEQLIEITTPTGTTAVLPITIDEPGEPGEPETPTITLSVGTIAAGGSLTISGAGLEQGAPVTVELHSEPAVLGQATADENGEFTLRATVPASTPAGSHTVVVLVDGVEVASAPLTVTAAVGAGSGSGEDLASTGFEGGALAAAAGLLLLAGLATVAVARRRRGARA